MTTLAQVSEHLQSLLTSVAEQAGRRSGFIRRKRKLDGASFVQTVVLGWMANPQASLDELSQVAYLCGVSISPQGLAERFSQSAATCLQEVLESSLMTVVQAEGECTGLLARFKGIYIQDSTVIGLPAGLKQIWSGCGNQSGGSAGLKLQTVLDYQQGRLSFQLYPAQRHDNPLQTLDLPVGSLRLADTGYFHVGRLQALTQRGVYWLTRLPAHVQIWDQAAGQVTTLRDYLDNYVQGDSCDEWVCLTAQGWSCRLLAQRVPAEVAQQRAERLWAEARRRRQGVSQQGLRLCGWTIMITNLADDALSLKDALVLLRLRWQIELLFKLFKSHAQLTHSRSQQPWRILCEVYAKLVGLVIQHWLLLVGCWHLPDRSLVKAACLVRKQVLHLACVLDDPARLLLTLTELCSVLSVCRIRKRKTRPATFQLLTGLSP